MVSNQVRHKAGCTSVKMDRGLKFQIWKVDRLYCPFSKTKVAKPLNSHMHKAGLLMTQLEYNLSKLISCAITIQQSAPLIPHIQKAVQKAGFLMMRLKIKPSM